VTWLRVVALALCLCIFGAGWSWLDRSNEKGFDLWKMRALILVVMLALLVPLLGGFPSEHHATKAQEEATSEISASEAAEHP